MERRAILFVGAGIEAVPGIRRAQDMGLFVVASDADANAPGMAVADDRIVASTYDVDATVASATVYHGTRPFAGVLCLATDVPLTVATVANALGLPGIPLSAARLVVDKLAMKDRFSLDGIPIPWYRRVADASELRQIVANEGVPLVLKPVDSRGARGVLRLLPGIDLNWAFETALSHSPSGRVMVERYLDGPQVSTESLVIAGRASTPGFSDRNYEFLDRFAPHMIENGGELPSALPAAQRAAVCELVERAARSLGIADGVVKGDIVIYKGGAHVIELAARLSGGYFCTHEIPLNTGVDFVGAALRQALGDKVLPDELQPRFCRGVAQRYLFPNPGRVSSVDVPDWIRRDPDIALCEIRVQPGATIGPMASHPARAGVVIATGESREAAVTKAEAALSAIRIETAT